MNVLYLGDIVGKPGRKLIKDHLPQLRREFDIDLCIANGENIAQGNRAFSTLSTNSDDDSIITIFHAVLH